MANESGNKQEGNKGGIGPVIIIGLIFVITIGAIWYISQSGDGAGDGAANTATPANTGNPANDGRLPNYSTAPAGGTNHFKGGENAAVVVEEFADFQCPTCATVHPRMNEINAKYGSKIKFVFRHYPLRIHPNAYDAAVASEAAAQQGKFWDMQNLLFSNQPQWANSGEARRIFAEYAQRIGLDVDKFNNDLLSLATKTRVDMDLNRARALNLTGTPSILVNGKPVSSFETNAISAAIDAELELVSPKEDRVQPAEGNQENKASE